MFPVKSFQKFRMRFLMWYRYALRENLSAERINELFAELPMDRQEYWLKRIQKVVESPYNSRLPRHRNAGEVRRGLLCMHQGTLIDPLSYCGIPMLKLLMDNRGVHEPEEESCFAKAVALMPSGAVMLELGSYWGFYSLWFKQAVTNSKVLLVEPNSECLASGRRNFFLNGESAIYENVAVGRMPRRGDSITETHVLTVGEICAKHGIDHINMLHADIQGAEFEMLQQASELYKRKQIDWVFLSTHSQSLHESCMNYLCSLGYAVEKSIDLENISSYDGLLVMRSGLVDE